MKIVYFDTSTYNKISELPASKSMIQMFGEAIESRIFEIIFSLLNFEEFSHTTDVDKRTRLFKLAHSICSDKIFLCHDELLRKELEAFMKETILDRKNLYYIDNNLFQKAIDGSLFKNIPSDLFQKMKNKKHDYLEFEKSSKKELIPSWKGYNNIEFEEFYKRTLQNNQGKAILKEICVKALENEINEDDLSKINLERMSGLRFLFKYICASMYSQLLKNKQPKWGSGIDMNHSVFIGNSDVFVTGDDDFLDIVILFNEPQTECLSLNGFINKYVQVNK